MSERKRANENHPDYPEYIEKCKKLSEIYFKQEDELAARYSGWRGLDSPAGTEIKQIHKEHNAKLKALQKEYAHIFTEEI